jgi:mannose-6-phosphate isomerase-like protein (cupin superfamily)
MAYTVISAAEDAFQPPSWKPSEPLRRLVELRRYAPLRHSQANLWRYPPGAQGRRHREPLQEEVFCVVQGTLTMFLGDPPERFALPPCSIVIVEPLTPLQIRNESESDAVFFAYGAPEQDSDYQAEILVDA